MNNLFDNLPVNMNQERVDVFAENSQIRIERIVSTGQCSPPGFWYDQPTCEWVCLLRGRARLLFRDDTDPVELAAGDWLLIPAHRQHRVEWTAPEEPTVWLAIFFAGHNE